MKTPNASNPGEAGRSRNWLYGATFVLILCIFTVLIAEIGIRITLGFIVGSRVILYGTEEFRDGRTIPSMVMKKVGYTPPTPAEPIGPYAKFKSHEVTFDKDEDGNRFSPTINNRGFRGPEFSDEKEPGVVRIATLGTSSTFRYHDRDDQTYPYYLQQILNEAGNGKANFEVLNLGIPHIDSDQILSLFLNEVLILQPDVITIYTGFNDSGKGWSELADRNSGSSAFSTMYETARQRSLLLASVDSLFNYAGMRLYYQDDFYHLLDSKVDHLLSNLERISAECQKRGILFIVANQQAKSRLIPRDQIKGTTYSGELDMVRQQSEKDGVPRRALAFLVHGELMRGLREWAELKDIPFVDVIGALDSDRDVLLTYVHLNTNGNKMIADEFAQKILDQIGGRPDQSQH